MALIGKIPVSKRKKHVLAAEPGSQEIEPVQEKLEGDKLLKSAEGEPSPTKLI